MDCSEFREAYSDYADGLLDETTEVEARRHLALCPECRRLDSAFRAGIEELRAMPAVAPSCGFDLELERRLMHEAEAATPAFRRWSGAAGGLLVVVVVGLVGLEWAERGTQRPAPSTVASRESLRLKPASLPPIPAPSVQLTSDSFFAYDDPFHPIPIGADPHRAFYAQQLRFDTPVVMAGR